MDDLISRQNAIEAIENIDPFIAWLDYAADVIKALPSAQSEPRWIPVTEWLPKANEKDENGFIKAYLVQDARWMDVARWDGKHWVAWGYGTVLKDVIAWMPLPKPYERSEDE